MSLPADVVCDLTNFLTDLAKDLHHNSTLQSLAVLRYLADREATFERTLNSSNAVVEVRMSLRALDGIIKMGIFAEHAHDIGRTACILRHHQCSV